MGQMVERLATSAPQHERDWPPEFAN